MTGGTSRIMMPWRDANGDAAGGSPRGRAARAPRHDRSDGRLGETGPGRYKASTPALQAQFLAPPEAVDLVAYGRCVQQDAEILWSEVEVAAADDRRVFARGTVIYRIVA